MILNSPIYLYSNSCNTPISGDIDSCCSIESILKSIADVIRRIAWYGLNHFNLSEINDLKINDLVANFSILNIVKSYTGLVDYIFRVFITQFGFAFWDLIYVNANLFKAYTGRGIYLFQSHSVRTKAILSNENALFNSTKEFIV